MTTLAITIQTPPHGASGQTGNTSATTPTSEANTAGNSFVDALVSFLKSLPDRPARRSGNVTGFDLLAPLTAGNSYLLLLSVDTAPGAVDHYELLKLLPAGSGVSALGEFRLLDSVWRPRKRNLRSRAAFVIHTPPVGELETSGSRPDSTDVQISEEKAGRDHFLEGRHRFCNHCSVSRPFTRDRSPVLICSASANGRNSTTICCCSPPTTSRFTSAKTSSSRRCRQDRRSPRWAISKTSHNTPHRLPSAPPRSHAAASRDGWVVDAGRPRPPRSRPAPTTDTSEARRTAAAHSRLRTDSDNFLPMWSGWLAPKPQAASEVSMATSLNGVGMQMRTRSNGSSRSSRCASRWVARVQRDVCEVQQTEPRSSMTPSGPSRAPSGCAKP